jgi:hypothetical protein
LFVPFSEYDRETGAIADATPEVEPADAGCDADLSLDKENCGACGRSCLGATCIVGLCVPQLTLQLPNTVPVGLATDETYLYASLFVGENKDGIQSAVVRVKKGSTEPPQIVAIPLGPNTLRLAVDDTRVFWTQGAFSDAGAGARGVGTSPKAPSPDGGPHLGVMLATGQPSPYALAIDDKGVFWTNYPQGNDVWGAAKSFPDPRVLAPQQFASSVAADDRSIYWPQLLPAGKIMRAAKDGGPQDPVAINQDVPLSVTVDATHVYWGTAGSNGSGSVLRAPKSGGPPEEIARAQFRPTVLVARGDYIYWMNANQENQSDGMIVRAPKTGGKAVLLAVSLNPFDMAVDDTNVYWSSTEGVFRVPR